jgi:hypothetical protein
MDAARSVDGYTLKLTEGSFNEALVVMQHKRPLCPIHNKEPLNKKKSTLIEAIKKKRKQTYLCASII